jgi:hypothetical protein
MLNRLKVRAGHTYTTHKGAKYIHMKLKNVSLSSFHSGSEYILLPYQTQNNPFPSFPLIFLGELETLYYNFLPYAPLSIKHKTTPFHLDGKDASFPLIF